MAERDAASNNASARQQPTSKAATEASATDRLKPYAATAPVGQSANKRTMGAEQSVEAGYDDDDDDDVDFRTDSFDDDGGTNSGVVAGADDNRRRGAVPSASSRSSSSQVRQQQQQQQFETFSEDASAAGGGVAGEKMPLKPSDVVQMIERPPPGKSSKKKGGSKKAALFRKMLLLCNPGNQAYNFLVIKKAADSTRDGYDERTAATELVDEILQQGGRFMTVQVDSGKTAPNQLPDGTPMTRHEAIEMAIASLRRAPAENKKPVEESYVIDDDDDDQSVAANTTNNQQAVAAGADSGKKLASTAANTIRMQQTSLGLAPAAPSPPSKATQPRPILSYSPKYFTPGEWVTVLQTDVVVPSGDTSLMRRVAQQHGGNQAYKHAVVSQLRASQEQRRLHGSDDTPPSSAEMDRDVLVVLTRMERQGGRFVSVGKFGGEYLPKRGKVMSRQDVIRRIRVDLRAALPPQPSPPPAPIPAKPARKNATASESARPAPAARPPAGMQVVPPPWMYPGAQGHAFPYRNIPYHPMAMPMSPEQRTPAGYIGGMQPGSAYTARLPQHSPISSSEKPAAPAASTTPPGAYAQQAAARVGQMPAMSPPPPQISTPPPPPKRCPPKKPKRKLTKLDIEKAIPPDASSIVHVFDRRIDLDAHDCEATLYSLLRSWVQDDPLRRIAPPGLDLSELEENSRSLAPPTATLGTSAFGRKKPVSPSPPCEPCDVVAKLNTSGDDGAEAPSIDQLRGSMILKAKNVKRRKVAKHRKQDAEAVESLKRRGIYLPS